MTLEVDALESVATAHTLRERVGARLGARQNWMTLDEWSIILVVALLYAGGNLLNFDATRLQQTGEHNESATLPILAEVSLWRYHEIPLWNPYMLTGYPLAGDFVNHFWNPVSTLPVLLWGGINGMKVSIFISFLLAGIGQWLFAHVFGLRGLVRLWAAILFMVSGGVALLWRVGWYELLLGVVWFPWCFASLWWALRRRDRASLAWTSLCVAMVLTAGGGYYLFYLFASMSVLVIMAILIGGAGEYWIRFRRAAVIAMLGAGLAAVAYLPLIDGYIHTRRDVAPEREQKSSQPVAYALMNYAISQPEWFRSEILGGLSGYTWFYIGALPLAALALVPLAWRTRRYRSAAMALFALTLFLLLWHANKYSPFKYIYEWIPNLYTLRFPNRLLIVATSPLLVLAGLGFAYLYDVVRRLGGGYSIALSVQKMQAITQIFSAQRIVTAVFAIVLGVSVWNVYTVNKDFAFARSGNLDSKSFTALSWLKAYDRGLYYTNIGGGLIYWWWTPAAYTLEMPVINFQYNRHLASQEIQHAAGSIFFAKPKYMLVQADQPRPDGAQLLRDFDGVGLWQLSDSLPFAFTVPSARLLSSTAITPKDVSAFQVHLDGPNRLVATGATAQDDRLVVLVSNYPGWQLRVDDHSATIAPVNGYLGATALPGEHTYTFLFHPAQHDIGLGITVVTLLVVLGMIAPLSSFRHWKHSPR